MTVPFALPHLVRDGFDLNPDFPPADADPRGPIGLPAPGGRSIWIVSRAEEVREILADHERFSSSSFRPGVAGHVREEPAGGSPDARGEPGPPQSFSLLMADPPEHTRLRRMLAGQFTARRIRWVEPRIAAIVASCLDDLRAAGSPSELISAFALPVPSLVICELLGVPYADRDRFQRRTALAASKTLTQAERDEVNRESRDYMGELVDRTTHDPGDDILGMLVRDHRDDLTRDELVAMADLLLFAGHETTASMLGLGTLALLQHPGQLARLRDDPALIGPAVEELLRYLSVLQMSIPRTATRDTEIAGRPVVRGDLVMVSLSAANRDPDLYDTPHRLDVDRPAAPHLAFGHGIHHCLGAQLARAELRVALPALWERFPGLALDPEQDAVFRPTDVFFGLARLPVTW